MLKVRLQRVGRRNDPSFRMVVIESTKGPKSRNYLEMVGSYNPRQKKVTVDGERVKHWIARGAQVSPTVHNILVTEKVIDGKKVNVLPKRSPVIKESAEEAKEETPKAEGEEAAAEAPAEEVKTEAEAPAEEPKAEEKEETPAEEETATEEPEPAPEAPKDEAPVEASAEENKEEEKKETA